MESSSATHQSKVQITDGIMSMKQEGMLNVLEVFHQIIHIKSAHDEITKVVLLGSATTIFPLNNIRKWFNSPPFSFLF
jgi:hypothetical protein